jgi:hypothetical protein
VCSGSRERRFLPARFPIRGPTLPPSPRFLGVPCGRAFRGCGSRPLPSAASFDRASAVIYLRPPAALSSGSAADRVQRADRSTLLRVIRRTTASRAGHSLQGHAPAKTAPAKKFLGTLVTRVPGFRAQERPDPPSQAQKDRRRLGEAARVREWMNGEPGRERALGTYVRTGGKRGDAAERSNVRARRPTRTECEQTANIASESGPIQSGKPWYRNASQCARANYETEGHRFESCLACSGKARSCGPSRCLGSSARGGRKAPRGIAGHCRSVPDIAGDIAGA